MALQLPASAAKLQSQTQQTRDQSTDTRALLDQIRRATALIDEAHKSEIERLKQNSAAVLKKLEKLNEQYEQAKQAYDGNVKMVVQLNEEIRSIRIKHSEEIAELKSKIAQLREENDALLCENVIMPTELAATLPLNMSPTIKPEVVRPTIEALQSANTAPKAWVDKDARMTLYQHDQIRSILRQFLRKARLKLPRAGDDYSTVSSWRKAPPAYTRLEERLAGGGFASIASFEDAFKHLIKDDVWSGLGFDVHRMYELKRFVLNEVEAIGGGSEIANQQDIVTPSKRTWKTADLDNGSSTERFRKWIVYTPGQHARPKK